MKTIVLIGNPNCGKTTLFNKLTNNNAHVGNWPGVTIEKKEGKLKYNNETFKIVDLPGIYSLSTSSPEEIITRNFLLDNDVDCIINIIDANNLSRSLYLTTQLMELDIPLIVTLNMLDEIINNNIQINTKELEKFLNVKIVSISALKEKNIDCLLSIMQNECQKYKIGQSVLLNSFLKDKIIYFYNNLKSKNINHSLFIATKILENDDYVKNKYFNESINNNYLDNIIFERYKYIDKIINKCYKQNNIKNKSYYIDKIVTNKILAYPILLFVLFIIFHLTFSTNLFYLRPFINKIFINRPNGLFQDVFVTDNGLNAIGPMFNNLLSNIQDILINKIAIFLINKPKWLNSFLINGIINGLIGVLEFLPQVICLYFFFTILEESGYMARVAFILDAPLRKIGLSGKTFLPLIMGFGCSIPAILNTKILEDEKEKITTIRIIPYLNCSAKLPFLVSLSAQIMLKLNLNNVDLLTMMFYVFGVIIALLSAFILRNTTLKSKESVFLMELPNYRIISFKILLKNLWKKCQDFLKKAFTIVLSSTLFGF